MKIKISNDEHAEVFLEDQEDEFVEHDRMTMKDDGEEEVRGLGAEQDLTTSLHPYPPKVTQ